MSRAGGLLVALFLAISACGEGTAGLAVMGSTQQALGPGTQRVILGLAADDGSLRGSPDLSVDATFSFGDEEGFTTPTEWVWAIPGVRGFYTATVDFDRPGRWEVVLDPADAPPTPPTPFGVQSDPIVPGIGDQAPPSETRTSADDDLARITSDPDPNPAFYRMSVAEAVTNGRPSVLVFATPAFCQTATCGPTLDVVESVMAARPGVDVVHVEIFENLDASAQGELVPVPAVGEWGLPSEPWVFVVDAGGIIRSRFEGALGPAELERALRAVGA